ncbi:hypothetical protein AB205_0108510 [Aquarana catesbeiana]|uniref:Uncharacterized protein n=1 Tax=Aquarana catesbeiana TaxID=8400 RepID=A0A2G9RW72_AQUCT|nr:hypothetical protein AB205_0108510 [Aquarana catesbeiana]
MAATQFGSGGSQPPVPTVMPQRRMRSPQQKCWQQGRVLPTSAQHQQQLQSSREAGQSASLLNRPRTAGLCPQLTEDGFPVKVDGTSVSTCIPQGCWAVSPDPQQHDRVSPVTLSSLQRQKGLQGEGPVQASPQRQICSLREAEVGWVSNALFGTIYLGTVWVQALEDWNYLPTSESTRLGSPPVLVFCRKGRDVMGGPVELRISWKVGDVLVSAPHIPLMSNAPYTRSDFPMENV